MFIVTLANFFAIILSFVGRLVKKEKLCFLLATTFLILFYSIRTDYGNDISGYMRTFERISTFSSTDVKESEERMEIGWIVINYLFQPFGWQIFIMSLTSVQFGTVYWLINKYASKSYYWIIFGLYVFNANLLLTDLSMLRQALAMHISCWSIPFVLNKKYLKSILVIFGASLFHTSAYAVLAVLFLPSLYKLRPKVIVILFLIIFISLTVAESIVGDMIKLVLASETFEKYSDYEAENSLSGTGLGVILQVLICMWLVLKYGKTKQSMFFNLTMCLAILMIPFSRSITMIGRVAMYFNLISIVSFQSLTNYRKDFIGVSLLLMYLYVMIIGYFAFFESSVWKPYFSIYHTIFE